MAVGLLIVAVIICGLGWLVCYMAASGLARYIIKKEHALPPSEDLRMCIKESIVYMFSRKG